MRSILRVAIALGFGVGVAYLVWRHIGTQLSVTTDIVGRTTFVDFDIYRYLYRFYDVVLVLPVACVLAYVALGWFGPFRSPPPDRDWPPVLEVTDTGSGPSSERNAVAASEGSDRMQGRDLLWALLRVGLVAFTVGIETNVSTSVHNTTLTAVSIAAGGVYAAVVAGATMAVGLRHRASPTAGKSIDGRGNGWLSRALVSDLPMINAFASVIVIPLLVLVSSSTSVTIASNGRVVHYSWFPAWFGATVTAVVLLMLFRALLRANTPADRRSIERWMLILVVVPILIFMMTAGIAGAQGPFQAFDDSQAMVGARLTFWHGLWPWRDLFLLHGFLADDLYGAIGMWVLSPTRWGSNSGMSLFVVPFTFVALYSFIVYFARKNALLIAAGTLALVLGLVPGWWATRYVLLPVVLILFDRVLRQGSWARCLILMVSVVFFSIVTPEATLLMVGILATLVVAEAVHRPRHEPFAESFSRTLRCAATGSVCVGVWVVVLASTGTFSGFLSYYVTVSTGHELWGAYSPQWSLTGTPWATIAFALPIALFLLTVLKIVVKLARRTPWRPLEWVLVASSTPVLLFYQVALDRMDYGHVFEVFQTLVPFVLLWAMEIVRVADAVVVRSWSWVMRQRPHRAGIRLAVPITVLGVVAIAAGSPSTPASWRNIPGAFHVEVPVDAPSSLPLGYTQPGAVDIAQITDLGKVLDRYAGRNGPVFDFTNEMGITYFLLDRVPGARFYHVESAQTARAQNIEVNDLRQSRPSVVIFNDTAYGLPAYDGIWSMERNYIVSQYILDHYHPLLDTHGQLIMLRNDLMKTATPLPRLSEPPLTSGLYFDPNMPACDWGDVPNFLVHPPPAATDGGLNLPAQYAGTLRIVSAGGWAFDTVDDQPAAEVLVASGSQVVSEFQPSLPRPDVAQVLHTQAAAHSGFQVHFGYVGGAAFQLYVLNQDGTVTPLSQTRDGATGTLPPTITTSDGVVHPIRTSAAEGGVDSVSEASWRTFTLSIPTGTNLSSYQWMVMHSPHAFGTSQMQITDSVNGGISHLIAWNTLPRTGGQVFSRVGSCLQWHGYRTSTLTLLDSGPLYTFSVKLVK